MHDSKKTGDGRLLRQTPAVSEQSLRFVGHWRRLCSEFLPHYAEGSIWRYGRGWLPTDPHQGWKIHISATILTACDALAAVAPYLKESGAAFKAAASLDHLARINSGLWHGYSQVGKFVTIYPSSEEDFRETVETLYRLIPAGLAAPAVPFDLRYRESNIYYRYGSFIAKGNSQPMLQAPEGELVPDRRDTPAPDWARSPFSDDTYINDSAPSPLSTRYYVFQSLTQRGKGGVYRAIDSSSDPVRVCIIKEGRRHGETAWDGRDGRSLVENEAKALADLRRKSVNVPIVFDSFEINGNFYLVLEEIGGKPLQKLLAPRRRRLSLGDTLYKCKEISRVLAAIHAAGWVWRDAKPANLFVEKGGTRV